MKATVPENMQCHFPLYFTAPQPTHTQELAYGLSLSTQCIYSRLFNPRCIPCASPLKSSIGKSKKTVVALKKTGMEKYTVLYFVFFSCHSHTSSPAHTASRITLWAALSPTSPWCSPGTSACLMLMLSGENF